jgi:hypothetical protein
MGLMSAPPSYIVILVLRTRKMEVKRSEENRPSDSGAQPRGFWASVYVEIEPVVKHGLASMVVATFVVVIGAFARILEWALPEQAWLTDYIQKFDIWILGVLLFLFVLYTIILVITRLYREARSFSQDH